MRGNDTFTESLFTMRRLDDFVPKNHPLRSVRTMVNAALKNIEPLLSGMYAADIKGGRPSVAPEKLLRAMLLQIFYSIRSERLLMEQTQYNLLFRWFIGLSMDDTVWVPTVFTKNRERLIAHDAVIELFNEVLGIDIGGGLVGVVTASSRSVRATRSSWHGLRLVVAHHPQRAKEQTQLRQERIAALQTQAQAWRSSNHEAAWVSMR